MAEIYEAIEEADPRDLPVIKKYICWVAFRRRMHNQFYLQAHWVQKPIPQLSMPRAHWIS